jgi:Mg-chelatase subunit ChlI
MIKLINLLKEIQSSPKALLLAGAPGAGKGSILNNLGLDNINQDLLHTVIEGEPGTGKTQWAYSEVGQELQEGNDVAPCIFCKSQRRMRY